MTITVCDDKKKYGFQSKLGGLEKIFDCEDLSLPLNEQKIAPINSMVKTDKYSESEKKQLTVFNLVAADRKDLVDSLARLLLSSVPQENTMTASGPFFLDQVQEIRNNNPDPFEQHLGFGLNHSFIVSTQTKKNLWQLAFSLSGEKKTTPVIWKNTNDNCWIDDCASFPDNQSLFIDKAAVQIRIKKDLTATLKILKVQNNVRILF